MNPARPIETAGACGLYTPTRSAHLIRNTDPVILIDLRPDLEDPRAFLRSMAWSTAAATPWLVDAQFQALQNSGHVRLLRKLGPDMSLAGTYQTPEVMFSQIERIQGAYPVVVNQIIPAQLQPEFSQLSWYVLENDAPSLVDDDDLQQAIANIRARRTELLGLARNEAAVATAKWYALARIKLELQQTLESLAQWDHSPTSVEEDLARCAEPAPARQQT